jgi:hypothetical protein
MQLRKKTGDKLEPDKLQPSRFSFAIRALFSGLHIYRAINYNSAQEVFTYYAQRFLIMLTPFEFGYFVKQALDGLGARGMPGMPKAPQAARPSLAATATPARSPAQIPKPAAPSLPPMGPARNAYEQHAQQRVIHQFGGPASKPVDASQWSSFSPEQLKMMDSDVAQRMMNQFGGHQGLSNAAGQLLQQQQQQ